MRTGEEESESDAVPDSPSLQAPEDAAAEDELPAPSRSRSRLQRQTTARSSLQTHDPAPTGSLSSPRTSALRPPYSARRAEAASLAMPQ